MKKKHPFFPFLIALMGLLIQITSVRFLSQSDGFIAQIRPVSRLISNTIGNICSFFPFSVGDVLYLLLALYTIWIVTRLVNAVIQKKWRKNAVFFFRFALILNLLYFTFHLNWGFHYYTTSKVLSYEKVDPSSITPEELKRYSNKYLGKTKALRPSYNTTPNTELVYHFDAQRTQMFSNEINRLNFVKPSLFSFLLNYLGVAGYYNPFTAECQYNRNIPTAKIPFTIAHEVAHQQGVAPEDKANFIGFIKSAESGLKAEAYSGNYRALRSLLTALLPKDSVYVKNIVAQYTSGMEADRLANQRFSEKYNGKVRSAFRGLNNVYLKANQQIGVESYNNFLLYLVAYERDSVSRSISNPKAQ